VGDVVTVVFSSPTDTPDGATAAVFSPPIGTTATSWRSGGRELQVRVDVAAGVDPAAVDVANGRLTVTVRALTAMGL
jgi:hypothetical protein